MKIQSQITDTVNTNLPFADSLLFFNPKSQKDSLDSVSTITPAVPSLFQGSGQISHEINSQIRTRYNDDWITIHLLIVLSLIAWVRVFYRKRFTQIIASFFGQHYQGMLIRDGNIFRERISIPLLVNYLITFSIFIYLFIVRFIKFNNIEFQGFKLFSLIIIAVLLLWIIKNIAILITGNLFKNPVILTDYITTHFVFNVTTGMLMLPVIIFANYVSMDYSIEAGILLWLIILAYRIIRQFLTGIEFSKFSLFNRLLYLCTFEIIPLLVVTKLILNNLK